MDGKITDQLVKRLMEGMTQKTGQATNKLRN